MTDSATAAAPATDTPPATLVNPDTTPPAADATPPPADPPAADAPAGDPPSAAPEGWGADWRQKYAGEDEKLLKRLERYASPKAVVDALLEAQTKISKGEFAKPLPADATPEQVAAWREANGIPAKADGYFDKLPDGLVLGDEDKKIFGEFAERMHAQNVPPAVMHEVVKWYNEFSEAQMAARADLEVQTRDATAEALREEWGADYKTNLNLAMNLVSSAPSGVKDRLLSARLGDGTPLLNDPAMMNWLVAQARELNPVVTLVPNSQNPSQGIEAEIQQIETTMRTNRAAYNRDVQMQTRYRQLLEARQKLAKAS